MRNIGSKAENAGYPDWHRSFQSERTIAPVKSLLYSSKYPGPGSIGEEDEQVQLMVARAPDGGWGWVVVACSFFCNMITDGIQYNFGNLLGPIRETFGASMAEVSLIGSLLSGFYNFVGEQ